MNPSTDFDLELERIDRDIRELETSARTVPVDSEKATRYAYRLFQRFSLTGDFADLKPAETAIKKSRQQFPEATDLSFLKANLDFKLHRLAAVRRALEASSVLRQSPQGRALQADLALQEGRYTDAEAGLINLIRDYRTWDNLARLAYYKAKMGETLKAEQLYLEAEDELTAKEMRHYAWVEIQRGRMAIDRGAYNDAMRHYQQAERAYSGYWLIAIHMAELLSAQEEDDEAAEIYQKLLTHLPRPEFQQALGQLYTRLGKPGQAQPWYDKALATYQEAANQGEVYYYHHLADFYADVLHDGAGAVEWAQKDLEVRENFWTQATLAWALYRAGRFREALGRMNQALSSGVHDADLFFRAAMIQLANGLSREANQYLQLATTINPHRRGSHEPHGIGFGS